MTALDTWKEEIERISAGLVILIRVETVQPENTLRIAPQFPGRPVIVRLLQQEPFLRQFVQAHALTVNYSGLEGAFHFILLNQARASDWEGLEDALLAHEYGHIWLAALGYRSPHYNDSCLATATGDIVQHILIREETARRGFDYLAFWKRIHDRWLASELEVSQPAPLDSCQRLLLLSSWTDATIAFESGQWENFDKYCALLKARHPSLAPVVERLASWLQARDLSDRSVYQSAIQYVAAALAELPPL